MSFGCRLNLVEGEAIARAAGARDIAIVNSCGVTNEAVRQARQAIRRLARAWPGRPVMVTGCAAEMEPASFAAMPEVAGLVGNAVKTQAESWAEGAAFPSPAGGRRWPDEVGSDEGVAERSCVDVARHAQRPHPTPLRGATFSRKREKERPSPLEEGIEGTRAFLAIQNGCDHSCTFCAIPRGRGAARSAPLADVVFRAQSLVERGFAEIVLTGVDLTSWGGDLPGTPRLGRLVRAILGGVPRLARLRLSSIDCIEADPDLVAAFAEEERLMPYLHLSLQSGDDMILKRMKRRHSRGQAVALCTELRRLRPDMAFGADLIAGFPTETDAMADATRALIEDCGLAFLHVFPYSPRPGTPAARMPQVAASVARERARRLREAGTTALSRHLAAQRGRTLPVLVERGGRGRAPDFSPVATGTLAPGRVVTLSITGDDGRRLLGTPAHG